MGKSMNHQYQKENSILTIIQSIKPSVAFWFILPSLILPIVLIGYPIFDVFWNSFHYVSRFGIVKGFVGIDNYLDLFEDEVFLESLIRTFWWTFFVVGFTVLLSLPIAVILNDNFYGRGIVRTIIMLPWAVSLAMNAVVWKWAFNGDIGMINHLLRQIGILDENIVWFSIAESAFIIEIIIGVIVSIPFTTTILMGGVASIDRDMYEAATIDGASPLRQFISLTFPMLKPFINIALILNIIYVFNSFPLIWIITRGGPSNGTHLLITYVYQRAFEFGKVGTGSAGSVIMLCILIVFCVFYFFITRKKSS
jgi:multiple sugar transport system permease protein